MIISIQTAPKLLKRITLSAALLTSALACKTAELAVDQGLKTETESYTVKGRQGSQIGQVLSYGGYRTDKVKRGWTFGYSLPFIVKFNGASEKISFTQFGPNGQAADVALISKFRETELAALEAFFSISFKYKNYYAGTVKPLDAGSGWDFIVHNVDGAERSLQKNSTAGFIRHGGTLIEIAGIRQLEGSPALLTQNEVYGYEFRLDGKVIGAVSTINNGKVWFKTGLNDELRLVLAGVSSGLMLRNAVERQV